MNRNSVVSDKPSIVWANNRILDVDRIDSKFYDVKFIKKQTKLMESHLPIMKLKDIITNMNAPIGWQGIPSSAYRKKGQGIPLIRIQNIKDNQVDLDSVIDVDPNIYEEQPAIQAEKNDIIITRVGTIGRLCKVPSDVSKVAMGQNLTRVSFNTDKVDVDFILTYMNTDYCLNQMLRFAYGGVQPSLTNKNIKDLLIVLPELKFQNYIGDKIRKVERLREEAKVLKAEAKKILYKTIAEEDILKIFRGDDSLSTWVEQEIIETRRLDANFYKEVYVDFDEYIYRNKDKFIKLKDIAILSKQRADLIKYGEKFIYLDISSLNEDTGVFEENEIYTNEAPSRAQKLVCLNDILVSTVRPNRKGIGIVTNDFDQQVASTGFAILQAKVNPYFLLLLLRNDIVTKQLIRFTSGGLYPAISEEELMEIYVPIVPENVMIQIGEKMKLYFSNLENSKKLILEAKKDVESLIEGTFDKKVTEAK
ncbi:restriction endonuclease subunit S [Priestia aryabhattai]|uniref:restriction endonuclease subunit S n=1 Tax=Priestia aryabhattai TaxID=412384 RepID=UPI0035AC0B33